jgi:hypothetical protein
MGAMERHRDAHPLLSGSSVCRVTYRVTHPASGTTHHASRLEELLQIGILARKRWGPDERIVIWLVVETCDPNHQVVTELNESTAPTCSSIAPEGTSGNVKEQKS